MEEHNSSWKPQFDLAKIDVLLEDAWQLKDATGERPARILVGRPVAFLDPRSGKELFACPFFVEGKTERVVTAVGLRPLNALMSACIGIREIFNKNRG